MITLPRPLTSRPSRYGRPAPGCGSSGTPGSDRRRAGVHEDDEADEVGQTWDRRTGLGMQHGSSKAETWQAMHEARILALQTYYAPHAGDAQAASNGKRALARSRAARKATVTLFEGTEAVIVQLWMVEGQGWFWRNKRWPKVKNRRREGPFVSKERAIKHAKRLLTDKPSLRTWSQEREAKNAS